MAVVKSDSQLVEEFRQGSKESFEDLIGRYAAKAFSLSLRLTKNQEDAEEVLQDVFVTVFNKINSFEGKSSFSSWLYRITVNTCFMKLRKRKQDRSTPMEDLPANWQQVNRAQINSQYETEIITIRNEMGDILEKAIQKLPEEYRPVFVLRDVDGLTSREVGKILNLTIPAVKSRLHRSRMMLRRRLKTMMKEQLGELLDVAEA